MLAKIKKNERAKLGSIILRSLFILASIFVIFYIWGSLSVFKLKGQLEFQNSSSYNFYQNPITRIVSIKKDGEILYRFFFKHRVFAAWIDETRPYVFLVTSDTGTLSGAQGLYIYNGKETKEVYQSRTIEFESGEKSAASLYSSWVYPDKFKENYESYIKDKKQEMNDRFFNISPDGRYLFGYESGYEGGVGFVVDLYNLTKIDLNFDGSDNLFWSTDKKCGINYVYGYGYHGLELVYFDGADLKVKSYYKNFMPDDFIGTYWIDNCSGVVAVKSDLITSYFKINKNEDILQKVNITNVSNLTKGEEFEWPLVNIFFTLKEPSKK